ncbi:MAG: aminotransferase class I/II-fold pyridoxal phosphate-dependent enzyme [Acidobacteria bacterium]|nr:aminotransferase class I/II-fold pyridoxal phosphate-dependent enzyme [Acidobacteriota bacterium]
MPELPLGPRRPEESLQDWLYRELRQAILDGRLGRGRKLPATRDLARQHGLSRGTVVAVFEQMRAEGYLISRVGSGTRVSERLPDERLSSGPAAPIEAPPVPGLDLAEKTSRPFHPNRPALAQFPVETWARIASRRLRRVTPGMLAGGDPQGYPALRQAVAEYLGASRGVRCVAEQVVVTSGVQQSLDLLARLLTGPGSRVWVEDPGYFGATDAFRHAGAEIVGVPVDESGLQVDEGLRLAPNAAAAYVTPGHHFGLGVTMSAARRIQLLGWARQTDAWVIEDDYDSEFRFSGRPVPALQGLDTAGRVIHLGTFNKTLFPALRLGYIVLPEALLEPFLRRRYELDRYPPTIPQAILAEFLAEGHFGRHLRRMRELYAERLEALQDDARRFLAGLAEIPAIQAGLFTTARLVNGMSSEEAERLAAEREITAFGLHRCCLRRTDIRGVQLGFAGYTRTEIRAGVLGLAAAWERRRGV